MMERLILADSFAMIMQRKILEFKSFISLMEACLLLEMPLSHQFRETI